MKFVKFSPFVVLLLLFNACQNANQDEPSPDFVNSFITTWEVSESSESIIIPIQQNLDYDYYVDWGDGSISHEKETATHTYETSGLYTVKISGTFPAINFDLYFSSMAPKIRSIDQWGGIEWQSMQGAFSGCVNLRYNATDTPNLLKVEDMSNMFNNAEVFNGAIGDWDVSNVISMKNMFYNAYAFNGDIGDWNVSNVTSMKNMFFGARSFNQDIGDWNVSNVTNMERAFYHARTFNQDIGDWDVSNVTNMSFMFSLALTFNQDISAWDVRRVSNMNRMFWAAFAFNQDISIWDVRSVLDMHSMFKEAHTFNQDISNWQVAGVTACTDFNDGSELTIEHLPDFTNCIF